jgi:hypothetical protein
VSQPTTKVDESVRTVGIHDSARSNRLLETEIDLFEHGIQPVITRKDAGRGRVSPLFASWRRESVWAVVESDMLDELSGLSVRWAFQGRACVTDVRIDAPRPRKLLTAWLDQPVLNTRKLPPIPQTIQSFFIASFDAEKSYQAFRDMLSALDPRGKVEVERIEKVVRNETGLRLRNDVLAHFGKSWWTFETGAGRANRQHDRSLLANSVIFAEVDDADAFVKVLETLALHLDRRAHFLEKAAIGKGNSKHDEPVHRAAIERITSPDRGFRLTSAGCRALGLDTDVEPVILVDHSFIALASDVDRAREALASTVKAERVRKPSGELAKALDCLPANLTLLAVVDHRDSSVPNRIVSLPSWLQFLCNMSLEPDPENASAKCLFDLLGIPRPGGVGIKIAPSLRPSVSDLSAHLFPSVLAGTTDDCGYRLISRVAFPGALLSDITSARASFGAAWTSTGGFRLREGISVRVFGVDPINWLD